MNHKTLQSYKKYYVVGNKFPQKSKICNRKIITSRIVEVYKLIN